MLSLRPLVFGTLLLATLPVMAVAASNLQPEHPAEVPETAEYTALRAGLWEVRTSTQMYDMPVELPPVPYRASHCLTQEQLNNQQNLTAVAGQQGECDIHDAQVSEQQTRWRMTCLKNGMRFNAQGSITPISLETYTGTVRFTMTGAQGMPPINGVTTIQGTWQGECVGVSDPTAGVEPVFSEPTAP